MKDKILQIAAQAKLGGAQFEEGIRYYVGTEETFCQFAELIIKECAKLGDEPTSFPFLTYGDKIKSYFEIK